MLPTFTKGWYLNCYKYQRRIFDVYPTICSRENSILFRGNSTIQFNLKKTDQTKQDRCFDQTNKKSGNYCN